MLKKIICSMEISLLLFPTIAIAGGYKIPEHSCNSTALSSAYVANAHGADSSYYNPANMVWEDDRALLEVGLKYIKQEHTRFSGTVGGFPADALSRQGEYYLPNFHFVSPRFGDFRFGVSLAQPFGLSMRWDTPFQKLFTEEYTLKIMELNPSFGYKINDHLSIGGGIRGFYSEGKAKSNGVTMINGVLPAQLTRNMKGDDVSFGYNLALTYKPVENLTLAATYHSKITSVLEGSGTLYSASALGTESYEGGGSVEANYPAWVYLAMAYTYNATTFEFVFERTFWGAYKQLDFEYNRPINRGIIKSVFDDPVAKNWADSNAYKFGITHKYNDTLTLMAGFAYDETPVPDKTLGFELPDSDSLVYSFGMKFHYDDNFTYGLAFIYNHETKNNIRNNNNGIEGSFSSNGYSLNLSINYSF